MHTIEIHDAEDQRLADYRSLTDQRWRRRIEGDEFFVAEGFVAVARVVDSGHRLRSVLLAPSRLDRFEAHVASAGPIGAPVYVAPAATIAEVVGFDLHRGVLAIAERRPAPTVADVASTARRVAVLEGLNDPENVGVIARAARALGVDAMVLDPRCTDPYTRRTVRVSMGEVLHLPVARAGSGWPSALDDLHRAGFESWALTPDPDADDIWTISSPDRLAIVLGAEGAGLDPTTLVRATRRVRIPIEADVDSLNVGHAAAIAFAVSGRA